ncbi:mannose-1-phosphate guanylyltransferase/mannose-6-phosphate isomerase [Litchfieldella rifensis]|uniref:mannose-1-phosphate guanylyltransferase n=1 Tax=Litchfieldella rifensis TaxID=762643 RepID=A0ABV7LID7_9GAMM
MLTPVILAGGIGMRLWPLSRRHYPKQFLPLAGETSLLQQTLARLEGLATASPVVVAHQDHRFLVAEQLRQQDFEDATLLLEPEGRDTAPAIAVAALAASAQGDDPVLLVLPSDHLIDDRMAFQASVGRAMALAERGWLVTFGVTPTHAETGYGYLQRGAPVGDEGGYRVRRFVEKPDRETAQTYLDSGEFLWNSGMFVFRASRYLAALEQRQPAMLGACRRAFAGAYADLDFLRLDAEAFAACPANSIDYAVMETTDDAAMVTLEAGWSDVGSWSALWEHQAHDAHGNVLRGDVIVEDSHNNLVHADSRLVTMLGVDDLVIVETSDALLITRRDRVQAVKQIVAQLQAAGRREPIEHPRVYRPWGHYQAIDAGPRYQVKRIHVAPGARLSRQMHHHRAEHWVVVSGIARVSIGDKTFLVGENQSTYIPVGQVHVLENPGIMPLELIEVQSGTYLGEDDIVRFDDRYGRA